MKGWHDCIVDKRIFSYGASLFSGWFRLEVGQSLINGILFQFINEYKTI